MLGLLEDLDINYKKYIYNILIILLIRCIFLFSSVIIKYIYNDKILNNNYDILEFPVNFNINDIFKSEIKKNDKMLKLMKNFIKKFEGYKFIISLSGGVDSMVLLFLLYNLVDKKDIITATINYNQRVESKSELKFLKLISKKLGILNYSRSVLNLDRKTNREYFEKKTQNMRFELYNFIIKYHNWSKNKTIILLGHHRDDVRENILNNFLSGRKLSDLEVMGLSLKKNNLSLYRPLIDIDKSEIYRVSHEYNIPYFKDTTPDWSKRGMMRRRLLPLLNEMYGNVNKLLDIQGEYSNNISKLVDSVSDIEIELVEDNIYKFIYQENEIILSEIISKILHKNGIKMISQKSMKTLLNRSKIDNWTMLSKNVRIKKDKYIYLFLNKN